MEVEALDDVESLKKRLEEEIEKNETLKKECERLRTSNARIVRDVEREEDAIANRLMRRFGQLKTEKEALVVQLEQEEEYLTNTLQKKLSQLQREKVELEQTLEVEEEFIVNRLQREITILQREKAALEKKVEKDRDMRLKALQDGIVQFRKTIQETGAIDVEDLCREFESEIAVIASKQDAIASEVRQIQAENEGMQEELRKVQNENRFLSEQTLKEKKLRLDAEMKLKKLELYQKVGLTGPPAHPPVHMRSRSGSHPPRYSAHMQSSLVGARSPLSGSPVVAPSRPAPSDSSPSHLFLTESPK